MIKFVRCEDADEVVRILTPLLEKIFKNCEADVVLRSKDDPNR